MDVMVSCGLKSSHISKQMQFQEARARPPTSAGCDLSCAVNGIVGEWGCKRHQPGQQDLLTMPGAFRGILKMQPSTLGLVGSLPGPAQAVRLGLGCSNQIFIIFDQKRKKNSSDTIDSGRSGSGGGETVSVGKIRLLCPPNLSMNTEKAHFRPCPRNEIKKKKKSLSHL